MQRPQWSRVLRCSGGDRTMWWSGVFRRPTAREPLDFQDGFNKEEKLQIVDGKRKCKDIFAVLARKNEKIKMGQCKSLSFWPLRENQSEVWFDFFISSKKDVSYTTDASALKLPGGIRFGTPNTSKGTNREIKLEVYFNTEIKVIGIDVETGNEATIFIDFLPRH